MKRATLAKHLRDDHERTNSWNETSAKFPHISKGMAFKIAMQGYDPKDQNIREHYKLGPRPCPTCKRKITKPRTVKAKPISRMSVEELRYCLENREPITL